MKKKRERLLQIVCIVICVFCVLVNIYFAYVKLNLYYVIMAALWGAFCMERVRHLRTEEEES